MRLINVETDELEEFFGDDIPEYAILSHTWESPGEEVSFDDFVEGKTATREYGAQKLKGFCNQARDDGYTYAWIDTCCIDKRNAVELGEAINSMFQWYKGAAICYVYLSDVLPGDDFRRPESNFISSRWFRRGWTLQELLAPDELSFFDRGWTCIGTKGDMSTEIEAITGIPRQFLLGWENFRTASVAQRMSWAANRKTTRKEDIAYCLLGIFDVTMAMIYGEGDRALIRLQQEIIKHTGDHSVLAWGLDAAESIAETPAQSAGILATTAAEFANCGSIVVKKQDTRPANTFDISSGRLRVQLCLQTFPSGETYGLLDCGPQGTEQVVAIPLHKVVSDVASNEYLRPQGRHPIYFPQPISNSVPKDIQILMERHESSHTKSRRYWFYVDGHKDMDLELSDIHPTVRWEKQRAMIAEVTDSNKTVIHRFLARFRALSSQSQDFIAMLEFQLQGLQAKARCHVMTFPRRTTLDFLSQTLTNMKPEEFERRSATNGVVCVKMTVKEEHLATFVVRLATMPTAEHLEEVALTHSRAHAQTVALAQMGLYVPQAREVKATHALKAAVRGNRSRKAALALLQQYSKTAEGEIIDLQGNQELDKQFKDMTKCNHGYQWTRQRAGWRCLGGAHFLTNEQFDTLNDRLDLKTAANDDELQMEDAVDDGSDTTGL
ncbi:heterokaryon incompatibility protein-domain-containing protein [Nemania sp. FL0916]|nr:heterokaryon incompatibility protein-domain-containing protein [Nemania sp. FL0916]